MESRAELREQLEEAIADVRRQIGVHARSAGALYPSGDTLTLKALEDELAQLESALANLGSDEASSGDRA